MKSILGPHLYMQTRVLQQYLMEPEEICVHLLSLGLGHFSDSVVRKVLKEQICKEANSIPHKLSLFLAFPPLLLLIVFTNLLLEQIKLSSLRQ